LTGGGNSLESGMDYSKYENNKPLELTSEERSAFQTRLRNLDDIPLTRAERREQGRKITNEMNLRSREVINEYDNEEDRLVNLLRTDLEEHFEMTGYSDQTKQKLWELSNLYDTPYSQCYENIGLVYEELSNLVKTVLK